MKIHKIFLFAGTLAIASGLLSSCKTPSDVAYFQDAATPVTIPTQALNSIKIQPYDRLQIVVSSKDPQLAMLFNLPVITSRVGQSSASYGTVTSGSNNAMSEGLSAYTVTSKGDIDFPILGMLHVEGMTREELAYYIKGEIVGRDLIKDPTVTVDFLNTGISILGEVKNPGRYVLNRDAITILDAIALAGDLDINGMRNNIRVMRNENGETKVYIVDLTNSKDLYNSPAYYLHQDDVVYVEPTDKRKRDSTVNGNQALSVSFWLSVTSVLTSVAVLVTNLIRK